MDRFVYQQRTAVMCDWFDALKSAANAFDSAYEPVPVRAWMGGSELIACIRRMGGTMRPLKPFYGWVLSQINQYGNSPVRTYAPELVGDDVSVTDFQGLMAIELDGETYFALRADEQASPMHIERALILAGRTLEAGLKLTARLKVVHNELFGDRIRHFGTELRPTDLEEVKEDDLILPPDFKGSLLDYLDRFWRSAALCENLRISPTRGVLFAGLPGTGKSLTIRHLLSRYPHCKGYIYVTESCGGIPGDTPFKHMLQEIGDEAVPAIVILEDIDRFFDSGSVTREFFLNVLDGLFRPACPVLWVATSNDPSRLEANVLDRPGRFDRVFVFPQPGHEERARLVRRYSPWPVADATVRDIADSSDGLSGAHLKEACCAAALVAAEHPEEYGKALREELARVMDQHEKASKYEFQLQKGRKAAFGNYV